MKTTPIFSGFLFLCMLALSGCTQNHYYYLQSTQPVPIFKEKNEIRASGYAGGGSFLNTRGGQAAWSITDHIAVMGNFNSFKLSRQMGLGDTGEGNNFELAGGYFRNYQKWGVFELYGGFAHGKERHTFHEDEVLGDTGWPFFFPIIQTQDRGSADITYFNYFVQPSYGVSYDYLDVALSTRFSNLYFSQVNNRVHDSIAAHGEVQRMRDTRYALLMEPAITVRGGWKYVKVQFQFGVCMGVAGCDFKYDSYNVGVGLSFAYAQRFRKTSTTNGN